MLKSRARNKAYVITEERKLYLIKYRETNREMHNEKAKIYKLKKKQEKLKKKQEQNII